MATAVATTTARAAPAPRAPQALVTAETENRLLVVDLPGGRVVRRVTLPADPEDIAASGNGSGGIIVVVSAGAGRVTVLRRSTLATIRSFGGFDQPHIVGVSTGGRYAYITDDMSGTLTTIRLHDPRRTSQITVGSGAHHLTFSPNGHQAWVALGESASRISILNTTNPAHPRVVGHLDPPFRVHDLSFTPNGRQVWMTSATGPDVTAFEASSHRPLFRLPVGAPPQHLVFAGRHAYLTSGYGGVIVEAGASTGHIIARARAPYGSFELDASDGYVVTSSLLRGTVAIYNTRLRPLRVVTAAPATREVAISRP